MNPVKLTDTPFLKKFQMFSVSLIGLGAVGTAASFFQDSTRAMANYVVAFAYILGIGITGMFFSALQFATRAGWSASVRRIAEMFSESIWLIIVGFIPVILSMKELFAWYDPLNWAGGHGPYTGHALHLIQDKQHDFLNPQFFIARVALYIIIWVGMYFIIVRNSLKQDSRPGDFRGTRTNFKRSAPFIILYALSTTFAGFDLLMSLETTWFSTMFGVYYFAGNFVSTLSLIGIFLAVLHKGGYLKGYIRPEHFHDIGKLMFAFSVFFAYIAFSQYMLIWYSNIPEETEYFIKRINGGWEYFGWFTVVFHFLVPFLLLIRQDVKRKTSMIIFTGLIILTAHFIDLSWIVLPVFSEHLRFGYQEISAFALMLGLFFFFVSLGFRKNSAVAINDPYMKESLEYQV